MLYNISQSVLPFRTRNMEFTKITQNIEFLPMYYIKKKTLIIYTIFEKSFVYFSGLNFISNNHHLIVKTRNEQNISAIHPSIWLKTGRGFSQTTYVDLFCQEHGPSFHLQLYILPVSIHSSRVPW